MVGSLLQPECCNGAVLGTTAMSWLSSQFLVVRSGVSKTATLVFGRASLNCSGHWQEGPWGVNPEGQRSPGRLGAPQEESLKDTGAACPPVLQDELAGRKTCVVEQGTCAETLGEKKSLPPVKEGTGNFGSVQGMCQDVQGANQEG